MTDGIQKEVVFLGEIVRIVIDPRIDSARANPPARSDDSGGGYVVDEVAEILDSPSTLSR